MKKTFWTVKYYIMGYGLSTMWFDNKVDAESFAKRVYCDKPVHRTYTNKNSIEEAEAYLRLCHSL